MTVDSKADYSGRRLEVTSQKLLLEFRIKYTVTVIPTVRWHLTSERQLSTSLHDFVFFTSTCESYPKNWTGSEG
jgi:hypothetical protein